MNPKKQLCTCGKTKTPPFCDHSHGGRPCIHMKEGKIDLAPIPKKILLIMLPYWDPLIPPQGIAHLKTYLQYHGFIVKTEDANIKKEFKDIYNRYFEVLKKYVPENKLGNFFNIGQDVMRNHMLAHINYTDEKEYIELVEAIIHETYFTRFDDEQAGELVELQDEFYRLLEDYILDLLLEEKPAVLGLSVPRDTIGPSLFAFRLTKEKFPCIRTVMGGPIFSDQLLPGTPNFEYFSEKTPYIDNIIIGEGQQLFLKLLKGELPASQKVLTREDNAGESLGFSPLNVPDMTDFEVERDYPLLAAQASGSCPYQCSFCNVAAYFGKYREKESAQVVKEMTALYKKYGVQVFYMNDALLNLVAAGLAAEIIKSGVPLYWDGYLRVSDSVCDIENALHWRRGGFYRARLGVESGSQHVLDLMHKKITPAQIHDALFSLANAGIKTTSYWVIGHPGETEEDFLQTLALLEETKDYIFEAECNPFIFGYGGQADSGRWQGRRKLLYPEKVKEMLMLQTWVVDTYPSREETYRRVNRFVRRCSELGLPNPYSLHDIYKADRRWQKLHKRAVPALVDFKEKNAYIDECKHIKQSILIPDAIEDEGEFGF